MANYRRSPVVGFSRLSDRLPEISFRRMPRNARFRQKAALGATGSFASASKLEANWSRDWGPERTPDAAEVNTDY
jgi:hypothetical protein